MRETLDRLIDVWASPRLEPIARGLVYVAAALLFLEAAATVHVVFTVPLSYIATLLAVCIGGGFVVRGWGRLPALLRWSAAALFVAYAITTAVGHPLTLPGQPRTGSIRSAVYLGDLALGLAAVGLVVGVIVTPQQIRRLIWSFVLGGFVGAAFAAYEWLARHYALPFSDINNTLNSNGITSGVYQGAGAFGWERARGTFLEPHFLGDYAASLLPLAVGLAIASRSKGRYVAGAAALALAAALVLTSSAPAGAILAFGVGLSSVCFLVARGAVLRATVAGGAVAGLLVIVPLALSQPTAVAAVTNRSQADVSSTIKFRTETWSRALTIWEQQPLLGYGAGQSSVQLAAARDVAPDQRPATPTALQSAQGIWAASLIDAGIVGLGLWTLLLSCIILLALSIVWRRPTAVTWAAAAAVAAAVAGALITGDRLDLRVWLLIGLATTLLCAEREVTADESSNRH